VRYHDIRRALIFADHLSQTFKAFDLE